MLVFVTPDRAWRIECRPRRIEAWRIFPGGKIAGTPAVRCALIADLELWLRDQLGLTLADLTEA